MKKITFILAFLYCINVFSQDDKPTMQGNYLIGGSFTTDYIKYSNFKIFEINLNPNVGYFIINHLAIGASLPLGYYNFIGGPSNYEYTIGLGPFAKYYTDQGLFFSFQLTYNIAKQYDNSGTANQYTTDNLSLSPGIGYAYFLNSKTSLEFGLYYEYLKETIKNNDNTYAPTTNISKINSLDFKVGFQIFL